MTEIIANRGIPHLSDKVFSFLDDWSLAQCRGVCQDWKEFIDTICTRTFYQRFEKRWEDEEYFLHNSAKKGFLYIFQICVKHIDEKTGFSDRDDSGWTPFHYAADR